MKSRIQKVKLTASKSSGIQKVFGVAVGEKKTIGREDFPANSQDLRMSKGHFEIHNQGDKVLVKDLESTNGLWINGQSKLSAGEHEIEDGSRIKAGDTTFEVTFDYGESTENPTLSSKHRTSNPDRSKEGRESRHSSGGVISSIQANSIIGGEYDEEPERDIPRFITPKKSSDLIAETSDALGRHSANEDKAIYQSLIDDGESSFDLSEQNLTESSSTDLEMLNQSTDDSFLTTEQALDFGEQAFRDSESNADVHPSHSAIRLKAAEQLVRRSSDENDTNCKKHFVADSLCVFNRLLEHLSDNQDSDLFATVVAHFLKAGTTVPDWLGGLSVFPRIEPSPSFLPVLVPLTEWIEQCHQDWTDPLVENDGLLLVVHAGTPFPKKQLQRIGSMPIEGFSKPNGILNWCWPSGLQSIVQHAHREHIDRWLPKMFNGIVYPLGCQGRCEALADDTFWPLLQQFGFHDSEM
jgi:hypothetical protein